MTSLNIIFIIKYIYIYMHVHIYIFIFIHTYIHDGTNTKLHHPFVVCWKWCFSPRSEFRSLVNEMEVTVGPPTSLRPEEVGWEGRS